MKKIFRLIAILVAIISSMSAWEINTHRAIDKEAAKWSENLKQFIQNAQIENEDYGSERFEGYGNHTYFSYVTRGETDGISQWDQNFTNTKYRALLEAGAILEDAQWNAGHTWSESIKQGDGRFVNHFYDAQDGGKGLIYHGYHFQNILNWEIKMG